MTNRKPLGCGHEDITGRHLRGLGRAEGKIRRFGRCVWADRAYSHLRLSQNKCARSPSNLTEGPADVAGHGIAHSIDCWL